VENIVREVRRSGKPEKNRGGRGGKNQSDVDRGEGGEEQGEPSIFFMTGSTLDGKKTKKKDF